MRRLILGITVLMLACAVAPSHVLAQEELDQLYLDRSLGKLGRGLANVVTCPGEIIRMVEIEGTDKGYVAAISSGLAKGVGRTVLRAGAGVTELLTFYAAWPNDFGPIIEPEYVYAHGNFDQRQ